MRIGIVVNTLLPAKPGPTTYSIACEAANRGHDVWMTTTGRISYGVDDRVEVSARAAPKRKRYSMAQFVKAVQDDTAVDADFAMSNFDVLLLRNNPTAQKDWVQSATLQFAQFAKERGVVVLPDPIGLAKAANKLYLSNFPQQVRPRTLVTRDLRKIVGMLQDEGTLILKPLAGYGGRGVFIVHKRDTGNLERIVQSITRDGYVVAQEYLPAANSGDVRLFMLGGEPLRHKNVYALVRRARTGHDIRSNVHAGGRAEATEITREMLEVADAVGPQLKTDGMFLVGLDIVGERLMEINVFSPGGIQDINRFYNSRFEKTIVDGIEDRVQRQQAAA